MSNLDHLAQAARRPSLAMLAGLALRSPYTTKSIATLRKHKANGAYDQDRAIKLLHGNVRYAARQTGRHYTCRDIAAVAAWLEESV